MKRISTLSKWFVMVFTIAALSGCQLFIKPRVAEKPVAPEKAVAVRKIETSREAPGGYWREARIGDFMLENKSIRVVVSGIGHMTQFSSSGGNIIDVAGKTTNLDYFGEFIFDSVAYAYERFEIVEPEDEAGGATLRFFGRSTSRPGIQVIQSYTLLPEEPIIQVTSSIENNTTEPLELSLKDKIIWGGAMLFVGRRGNPPSNSEVKVVTDWISGRADNFSMGLTVKQGMLDTTNANNISDVVYRKVTIPVGSRSELERFVYVADRDLSQISSYMIKLRNLSHGIISGTVVDTQGEAPVSDVEVRVRCNRLDGESLPAYPYSLTFSKEDGTFEIPVQEGSYFVTAHPVGRTASRATLSIDIPSGGTYVVKLRVSPPIQLSYDIRDADTGELLPAKITIISLPGKPVLDYGPAYNLPGSHNTYYAHTGQGEFLIPAQLYKIVVSRGIEYEIVEREVKIVAGEKNELKVELKRVLDTSGWISADIGVQTNLSPRCLVSPRDRVIAAVCEGVEWLVTGDSNTATDLQNAINELSFNKWIKASPGLCVDFEGTNGPGAFLVFPVEPDSAQAIARSIDEIAQLKPEKIFSHLRKTFPGALIQVNNPLDPETGYFKKYGYDAEGKKLPDSKDFSYDFDLLGIWHGKRMMAMEENLKLYNLLMQNGYTKGFSGGSFATFIYGEETGYPRMFIMSSTDDPSMINDTEMVDNIKAGKVILSNGPFIKVSVNNQTYSSIFKPAEELVDCALEIFAAPWVNINIINVNRNGSFVKWIFLPPHETIRRYPRKKEGPEEFKLSVKDEQFINVTVKGGRSLEPVVSPLSYPEGTPMMPFAISGPIFMDYNNNNVFDPTPEGEK